MKFLFYASPVDPDEALVTRIAVVAGDILEMPDDLLMFDSSFTGGNSVIPPPHVGCGIDHSHHFDAWKIQDMDYVITQARTSEGWEVIGTGNETQHLTTMTVVPIIGEIPSRDNSLLWYLQASNFFRTGVITFFSYVTYLRIQASQVLFSDSPPYW
ncbi:hypothetical protein TNCV_333621 [Trichonephila clavipes]|nr:hypothetical protein TNCV_333621 [Trichonephila clavipes]